MWQCRLEFQHSGFEALEESFSKTLHELSGAKRRTHMNSQNESYFHLRRLLHGRDKTTLYSLVIWVSKVKACREQEDPEPIVLLLASFTDTVTRVAVLTGNVICSRLSSAGVQASPACLYNPQREHCRDQNVRTGGLERERARGRERTWQGSRLGEREEGRRRWRTCSSGTRLQLTAGCYQQGRLTKRFSVVKCAARHRVAPCSCHRAPRGSPRSRLRL